MRKQSGGPQSRATFQLSRHSLPHGPRLKESLRCKAESCGCRRCSNYTRSGWRRGDKLPASGNFENGPDKLRARCYELEAEDPCFSTVSFLPSRRPFIPIILTAKSISKSLNTM